MFSCYHWKYRVPPLYPQRLVLTFSNLLLMTDCLGCCSDGYIDYRCTLPYYIHLPSLLHYLSCSHIRTVLIPQLGDGHPLMSPSICSSSWPQITKLILLTVPLTTVFLFLLWYPTSAKTQSELPLLLPCTPPPQAGYYSLVTPRHSFILLFLLPPC